MKFNNAYVVDDDKVHHFIIKKLLEKNDVRADISFFENGYEALNDLKVKLHNDENLPDLILLDINMPVLDGWQFLAEFNQIRKSFTCDIAIYVVSSSEHYFNAEKIQQFKDVITDYFVKPMTNDVIKTIFL
ncbi:response regulator [Flavobacterium sp. IMCC34852]|uniref:Response regulator n=1 Tax=Flavobacterium rivulicola TaxID=2732161 RepID=A0A7Y3R9T8_9FLAO|nr:response regulator [Flavobacterium sp. IMCC34852]NNT72081.1 response regulator [Flavobacterium sp. IMCC34852]